MKDSYNKTVGYPQKEFRTPVKRYCQTLDLKDDPALEIYILGTRLFMIVETPPDFDWDVAMAKLDTLPRQAEWEAYVSMFQQCRPGSTSSEKWQMMDRMFYLYEE